ncbi:MAG: 3-deoxy-8-phosphooctulonate synthase [Elusimicrobia bacterium]|nr:3-deoxy-8-phosphooctulonate synthase [Elusimicrobiota bacterium]
MPVHRVRLDNILFDNRRPLVCIAGTCSLESEELTYRTAHTLKLRLGRLRIPFVFKCSYDKANRTSIRSYRGPGWQRGLEILARIKNRLRVPLLTDVHETSQVPFAAEVADILQIPAFLSRQTDLVLACARTGKIVNVKKGQFLSPWEVRQVVKKIESTGNGKILLTERGTCFGYQNLVVDMRSLEILKGLGYPVLYDATHSLQLPGGLGHASSGQREFVFPLARAAVATGVAGLYLETHPQPDRALSDGPNSLKLAQVPGILSALKSIDAQVKSLLQ